jgi:hypothetical protein
VQYYVYEVTCSVSVKMPMYKTRKQSFNLIGQCHFWGGTVYHNNHRLVAAPWSWKEIGNNVCKVKNNCRVTLHRYHNAKSKFLVILDIISLHIKLSFHQAIVHLCKLFIVTCIFAFATVSSYITL